MDKKLPPSGNLDRPNVVVGIPAYYGWIRVEAALYLAEARSHGATLFPVKGQGIAVSRNVIVNEAQRRQADVVMMLDFDADPVPGTYKHLLDFALHNEAVIATPYTTSAGFVGVLGDDDATSLPVAQAVKLSGDRPVTNIGTHCCAYNMKVFDRIGKPYYHETYNEAMTALLSTEDCVCHRKLRRARVPIYCAWDWWAGHFKDRRIDKPEILDEAQLWAMLRA